MKETRKQKIARQQGHAADRAFDPIRDAIDRGDLVITPGRQVVKGFMHCGVPAVLGSPVDHGWCINRLILCQRCGVQLGIESTRTDDLASQK